MLSKKIKVILLILAVSVIAIQPQIVTAYDVERAISLNIVPISLQSDYTKPVTRAEFCGLAVSVYENIIQAEITERKEFADTDDINVQKMGGLGIAGGVGKGNFSPNSRITREESAVFFARILVNLGIYTKETDPTFDDNDKISGWAFVAVGQVQSLELMSGSDQNMFMPKANYTTEQAIISF